MLSAKAPSRDYRESPLLGAESIQVTGQKAILCMARMVKAQPARILRRQA